MSLCSSHMAQLQSFQTARAKLISGQSTAEFEFNGQRQSYSKADLNRLDGEISNLETAAATLGACGACPQTRRRGRAITWAA